MKRYFLSSISAVLKRDFQYVHPKNLLALRYEYVDTVPITASRKLFQVLIMWHLTSQDFRGHLEFFSYVTNSLHSLVTCLFT